jgi:hypothetical protein
MLVPLIVYALCASAITLGTLSVLVAFVEELRA